MATDNESKRGGSARIPSERPVYVTLGAIVIFELFVFTIWASLTLGRGFLVQRIDLLQSYLKAFDFFNIRGRCGSTV
ncbi:MAG: hypothetical protein ABSF09_04975 [Candidatus Bathyarchaeia archaeon]